MERLDGKEKEKEKEEGKEKEKEKERGRKGITSGLSFTSMEATPGSH